MQAAGNVKATGRVYDGVGEVMPKGAIIMWSGSSQNIPQGWKLCDGRDNTPNLVDRFVLGGTGSGSTGGNREIRLSSNQLPQHNHNLQGLDGQGTNSEGNKHLHFHITNTNTYQTTTNAQNYGTAASTVNIMPPYYTLCFIIKQ